MNSQIPMKELTQQINYMLLYVKEVLFALGKDVQN